MRRAVIVHECPKSLISAESIALLEQFHAWKRFNYLPARPMPARLAEALSVLEEQWVEEQELRRMQREEQHG